MSRARAVCETVHLLALSLWFGIVMAAGTAAAITFPAMKKLQPTLPEFASYTEPHWPIAGGKIVNRLFLAADIVQFVCSITAVVTLACLVIFWKLPRTSAATLVRAFALSVAFASFGGMLLVLIPSMNGALHAFWNAAAAGELESAARHKAAFDELHPTASAMMGLTAGSTLVALVAGLWSAVRGRTTHAAGAH